MDEETRLKLSASQHVFVMLAKCLLNNRALRPGQLSGALKATFNHPEAEYARADYEYFRQLANLLDEAETKDRLPDGYQGGGAMMRDQAG